MEVLSSPLGPAEARPITRKRVSFLPLSSMPRAAILSPYSSAASSLAIAAAPGSPAARSAARAVEEQSISSTDGQFSRIQARHCPKTSAFE